MILEKLFSLQDLGYAQFHSRLVPNVDKSHIIGVRMPALRALAKDLLKNHRCEYDDFIRELPHGFQEENILHAQYIETIKDFNEAMRLTEEFLPYIDNWAVCDSFKPRVFAKAPEAVFLQISQWLQSSHPYTVRYGVVLMLSNYLDENFQTTHLELLSKIHSEHYYINMALAWYFSFALIKQYETSISIFENPCLDAFVHNKAIQKAIESYRLDDDRKNYLKTLKIKRKGCSP